jgi:hypothetical protein
MATDGAVPETWLTVTPTGFEILERSPLLSTAMAEI